MSTIVRVALPADAAGTYISAPVPVFLPVLVGEGDVVALSDMRLVNMILRMNGQDENVNTVSIASGRRLLAVLSAAAVLCLERACA